MSKQSQRLAIFAAITHVFADKGVHFEPGMNAAPLLTDAYRGMVHAIVCEGFRKGTIELADTAANREKLASESEMNKYVSGLISNWLRKDTNLNGGSKYQPKNPGSRTGQSDEQIKTLRALAKKFASEPAKLSVINAQIEARKSEIAATKVKTIEVTEEQLAKLPAELRDMLEV